MLNKLCSTLTQILGNLGYFGSLQYTYRSISFKQQYSEVLEGTELHSLLAVESLQGWVLEYAKLMLSIN